MEFHITAEQRRLQERARCLAEDFATRAARHDREASHPVENYEALRDAGFYGLNVPTALGGSGVGLLGYSLAAEELGQGCASTALAFNMHLSIVGTPVPATRARRVDGGYRLTGRKAFASMLDVADYTAVLARPDDATAPTAGMIVLVPKGATGRRVEAVWDTLGMRATRSDSMILDDGWVSDEAVMVRSDDIVSFRRRGANWLWGSYTPVYLGVAVAAYKAIIETVRGRTPPGFAQPLAYHPDVRRHVAEMSVDLEAARLL